ncbi:MAG: FtsX-like permease family protein [Candidatus Thorarchaeota archaeon]
MRFSVWFVWKKGYKTLVKNKSKTIPIFILLVFAIAFSTLMFNMQDFRSHMIKEIKEYTNPPDATAYFEMIPESFCENQLKNITDTLEDYEIRMQMQLDFKVFGKEYDGLLIGVNSSRVNHMHELVDKNKEKLNDYKFAINWGFAERVGLGIGDNITLSYGSIKKEITVKNIGYNAEFQYSPLYSNLAFPTIRSYPILYVDLGYLSEQVLNRSDRVVNQFLYQFNDNLNASKVEKDIQNALKSFSVNIVPLEDQTFFKTMREDEKSDRQMLTFLTIILLTGAIITLILVTNKLVEKDLKSISVFQALGANKREITSSYLIFNILIVSLALILGVILSNIFAIPFTNYLVETFGFGFVPEIQFQFTNAIWIGSILFIVSILSTLLVVKKTFKMDVQHSLKYETKFLEKFNVIEKVYTKTKKNPHPFTIYNLRRIFGRKLHLVSLLIALSISGSFLIFFFGIDDGISYSLEKRFNEVEQWDCVANTWQYEDEFHTSIIFDSLSKFDNYEFAIFDVAPISKKDSNFEDYVRLIAYEEDSVMHIFNVEKGEKLQNQYDALLTKDLLKELSLSVGDVIYVKSIPFDNSTEFKIVGVVNEIATMTLYISIRDAQVLLNKTNCINTIFLTAKDDVEECAKEVQDLDEINTVNTLKSLQDEINFILDKSSAALLVFGIILMVFGVILILVVFKSITDYRMEDYSNMKAVGILDKEIRNSLFVEILFYLCVSFIFGIVLGIIFLRWMFKQWETEIPGLTSYIYPISYLYYISIFSGILLFSFYINYRKIKKINIAKIMREKTFG